MCLIVYNVYQIVSSVRLEYCITILKVPAPLERGGSGWGGSCQIRPYWHFHLPPNPSREGRGVKCKNLTGQYCQIVTQSLFR